MRNTKELGIRPPEQAEMEEIAAVFSEISKSSGVIIRTCAEAIDLGKYGIKPNSCIDKERIEAITGCKLKAKPDKQRDDCRCIECADIGMFNTCSHGCAYCYANFNRERVRNAVAEHKDDSPLLTGTVEQEKITEYGKGKSLKEEQTSLF